MLVSSENSDVELSYHTFMLCKIEQSRINMVSPLLVNLFGYITPGVKRKTASWSLNTYITTACLLGKVPRLGIPH